MAALLNHTVFIARLGSSILAVHKDDLKHIGSPRALEVQCVKIDLDRHEIADPWGLEQHLKFNPWEEVTDPSQQEGIRRLVLRTFSDEELQAKLLDALEKSRVK